MKEESVDNWVGQKKDQFNPREHQILVIEDNPVNMAVIRHVLQKSGYYVIEAVEGISGYEMASKCLPDLILLDVVMPGIDGFEVCQMLKKNVQTAEIPIIFMTGLTDTESVVQGFELGAVDYVTKPFKTPEVLARIHTHLTLQKLQKGLKREIVEREKLITDLDAFAHTVAHDLKNPINSIVGYSEILLENRHRLTQEQMESTLEYLLRNAFKMSDIIDSLLLLARVRQDEIKVETVDMGAVVNEGLVRVDQMVKQNDAKIIKAEKWPSVRGYGPWLEEVWVNYVTNALKYGGIPPVVELGVTLKSKNEAVFWVKDNGAGLTRAEQSKLFKPFVRLENSSSMGHGLGLSIVQRIIEKLGGHVGVRSNIGEGSTFYFALPVIH